MTSESSVLASLVHRGLVAVLTLENVAEAVPVARALIAGGVTAMELTLRTPAALEAMREISRRVPEMLLGAGTILTADQVSQAQDAGAHFGVAPGMSSRVVEAAMKRQFPFAPGIVTPSDIERALAYDRRLLKFFPCEPSGGLPYLEAIATPYAHLGIKYLPLGGVNESNCQKYWQHPLVGAIGGSWLAPHATIKAQAWEAITNNASRAMKLQAEIVQDNACS